METKIFCDICGSVLNENGFCPDPECQISTENTCKCLNNFRNLSVNNSYKSNRHQGQPRGKQVRA